MSDLFDYVAWRGDLSFKEVGYNKIDAFMFAHLSYLNFDGIAPVSFSERKTISQLAEDFKNSPDVKERSNMGLVINPRTPELLYACGESDRFGNVEICGYKSIIDEKRETQFAAMTFITEDAVIVAFRGTDDTIVGWKEDFNIAYQNPIPGQEEALKYLKDAVSSLDRDVVVVGHSKGGNLAVYSTVKFENKDRISKVFNFDGPGFSKEFFESEDFKKIEPKLKSVFPSFSVVGMIFNFSGDYEIIRSDQFAIMQHDPLVWQIQGADFVHEDDFTDQSKFFRKAFNQWLTDLNMEDKKRFIRAAFEIIEAAGFKTNYELSENKLAASAKMFAAFNSMDKETRNQIHDVVKMLRHVITSNLPFFNMIAL